jgi:6,7-dimethyl-8-ribityllumazine synthase
MTERYEDFRRPFDLDEAEEPERAPWDRDDDSYAAAPAYAAEDAVEDVEEEEAEPEPEPVAEAEAEPAYVAPVPEPEPKPEPEPEPEPAPESPPAAAAVPVDVDDHAPAELQIPGGYRTLEGEASGEHLAVALVVSRFNGEITNRLLKRALEELDACGVAKDAVTITVVPGAFELPLAAMALAKTRRYGCVVALGCVIRGKTRHFEYISSEAASGLQLAALETGTPVSFGVLTLENRKQAELRIDRAADAVHSALEMASMFAQLRATAQH